MSDSQPPESSEPPQRPLDPEKLLRIASLTREVLEEVRKMDPDEHTSAELASLHKRVTGQLHEALTPELIKELEAIDLDLHLENAQDGKKVRGPTGQEVRIAFAGLIGWLGGLFQGLQAAIQVQAIEAAAQAQKALQAPNNAEPEPRTGRYL